MDQADRDARFMAQAIALSLTHLGQTATNPSVGCLIVSRQGTVVGNGVTAIGGRPHAEVMALSVAGDNARGATAYVTLEPCAHYGGTPPCANAMVNAGIARVVVSVIDPDKRVAGKGLDILRAAGIEVTTGVLQNEGEEALQAYLMRKRAGRPFVTLKLAISNDGMIGLKGQGQVRITGTESRHFVQQLRAESDAILVGIGTVLADDPELTCRLPGLEHRSPVRIVLDRRLDLPLGSKLALTARVVPVMVVADVGAEGVDAYPPLSLRDISPSRGERGSAQDDHSKRAADIEPPPPALSPLEGEMSDRTEGVRRASAEDLEPLGIEVLEGDPHDLPTLLQTLGTRGISSLLVEGGAKTAKSFLDAGLVDRILLFTGPNALGIEDGIPSPVGRASVPAGFVHRQTLSFGNDRLDDYAFERGM